MQSLLRSGNPLTHGRRYLVCWSAWVWTAVWAGTTAFAQLSDVRNPPPDAAPVVSGLAFSPDGKWLAAATNLRGHGGPIVIWSVGDGRTGVVRFEPTGGLDVAFSPDGKLLAYSTRSRRVGLIEVATGDLVRDINAHEGVVFCVTFTRDGKSLLSAGEDSKIRQWNLTDGSLERTLKGHAEGVLGIAVSPDNRLLLSAGEDGETRLWEMPAGRVKWVFKPNSFCAGFVRFSRDGRFFLTWRGDSRVRIRETGTGQLRAMIAEKNRSADLSADNRFLATTGTGEAAEAQVFRIRLDPPTKQEQDRIREWIRELDDEDYEVREAASEKIAEIGMVAEPVLREAMDAGSPEVRLRARRLRLRVMAPQPIARLGGHRGEVGVVRFSQDDTLLATGSRGGDIKIWSVPEFKLLKTLGAPRKK